MNATVIAVGTQTQVREQGKALVGHKVDFLRNTGRSVDVKRGTVVRYSVGGGGNSPWFLKVTVSYRGGEYTVAADEIELV